jgi:hypothetical protein
MGPLYILLNFNFIAIQIRSPESLQKQGLPLIPESGFRTPDYLFIPLVLKPAAFGLDRGYDTVIFYFALAPVDFVFLKSYGRLCETRS